MKSKAPQGRRTPKRFREFRECCAYVPDCGVRQPRCRFPNCRAFLWTSKAFGAGTTALQQSVTKGLVLTIRALLAPFWIPVADAASPSADGAADTAAATEPRGPDAIGKKRLAGERAAVHSATQN